VRMAQKMPISAMAMPSRQCARELHPCFPSPRSCSEKRKDPLPGTGQCREDDSALHAEGRAPVAAQPVSASKCACFPHSKQKSCAFGTLQKTAWVTVCRHAASEELSIAKIKFRTFDLGGHEIGARQSTTRRGYKRALCSPLPLCASYLVLLGPGA